MSQINHAPRAAEILPRLPDGPIVGVEVGVYRGALAAELLRGKPDLTLWMVDAWGMPVGTPLTAWNDRKSKQVATNPMPHLAAALEATAFAADRRALLMGDSALPFTAVSPVDFVYLDAGHSYEAVRRDLAAWGKRIKPGGLLCGHDYAGQVRRAVDEYAAAQGLRIEVGVCLNWYAVPI